MADIAALIRERQRLAAEKTGKGQRPSELPAAAKAASESASPDEKEKPALRGKPPRAAATSRGATKYTPGRAPKPKAQASAGKPVDLSTRDRRWLAFARLYIFGGDGVPPFNGTRAYRAVYLGSSERAAQRSAYDLLSNPEFRPILLEVARQAWEKLELTEREVLEQITAASRANVFDYFDVDELGNLRLREVAALPVAAQRNVCKLRMRTRTIRQEGRAPIVEQTIELEVVNRLRALDMAARVLSMYKSSVDDATAETIAKLIQQGQERASRRGVRWNPETRKAEWTDEANEPETAAEGTRRH